MWSQNIRVIIVPSILAFAYIGPSFYLDSLADLDLLPLVMWLANNASTIIVQNQVAEADWGNKLGLTSLVASMSVNALVTGLIVFKIFKVFRRVRSLTTSIEKSLGIAGGAKLRSLIFVIIESGMVLFAVQLARVVVTISTPVQGEPDAASYAFAIIIAIHQMINVIISFSPLLLYVY